MWKKYFSRDFEGYFDKSFEFGRKKSIEPIKQLNPNVLIIDDTENIIHHNSKQSFILVDRWEGDPTDTQLLDVITKVMLKFSIKESNEDLISYLPK